jgi:lipopolysaccharide/colanic/teichoic acid biosynthesis glycosyltransferase
LLSPIFVIVTLGLFIANNGKPFFTQSRPGKNEKLFKILKFKTMNDKKDAEGNLLSDAERLTKIGSFVRKTSLDEIPQLMNVLTGAMSIIGPRPLLPEYLPFYSEEQRKRHLVKSGITGWAQVNGRNAISWEQKFEYDVWYVDNVTFVLDMKIVLLTLKKIIKPDGITAEGHVTMPRFDKMDVK